MRNFGDLKIRLILETVGKEAFRFIGIKILNNIRKLWKKSFKNANFMFKFNRKRK